MQVIENKWQPFTSVANTVWPNTLPFKVEFMADDGQRDTLIIQSFNDLDRLIDHQHIVSIRIHDVVDEETRFVRNLIADNMDPRYGNRPNSRYKPERVRQGSLDERYTTTVVRGIVRTFGLMGAKPEKVDVNLPRWVKDKLRPKYHRMVTDWLTDVNNEDYVLHNDLVERQLNNGLLAVRNYGHSGRRIVLPMGHSLAYTSAQKAYWRIIQTGTLMEYGHDMRVTVGELRGKHRQMIEHRATYHSGRGVITVGCQRIPFSALQELADREGWPKRDPNQ